MFLPFPSLSLHMAPPQSFPAPKSAWPPRLWALHQEGSWLHVAEGNSSSPLIPLEPRLPSQAAGQLVAGSHRGKGLSSCGPGGRGNPRKGVSGRWQELTPLGRFDGCLARVQEITFLGEAAFLSWHLREVSFVYSLPGDTVM